MEYEKIIDSLVERRESVTATRVRAGELWLATAENARFNALIQSLSEEQRALVAELLQSERDAGIHDCLAVLSELMNLQDLRFAVHGKEIPHEPYGTEMYFDWIARASGEPWPQGKAGK
ncbi:hypothetical protein GCM10027343_03010 [Noviherbaspirillum agri]